MIFFSVFHREINESIHAEDVSGVIFRFFVPLLLPSSKSPARAELIRKASGAADTERGAQKGARFSGSADSWSFQARNTQAKFPMTLTAEGYLSVR